MNAQLLKYRDKRLRGLPRGLRHVDTAFRRDPSCGDEYLLAWPDEAWSAPIYAYRGQARLFRRDSGGLTDLERAANMDPAGWILAWLGEGYRQSGRVEEARKAFDAALRLDPKYANSYSWRATLRLAAGDEGGALRDLDQALRLQPTARGHMERARVLRSLGRITDSLDALSAAVRLNPELGWGGLDPKGLETSLEEIRAAAAEPKADIRLPAWEGETLLRLGRPAEALTALDRGFKKAPRFGLGRVWRAQALTLLRRAPEARKELAVARRLASIYAPAHLLAAVLKLQEGKAEAALRPLARAIKCAPYSARLYRARAGALVRLDRRAAARRDLDRCLRLCPGFSDALRLKAAIDGASVEKVPSLVETDAVLTT